MSIPSRAGLSRHGAGDEPPAAPLDRRMWRTLDHIEAHLDGPLGLGDLAREVGLSRRRFSAVFRGATGLSAHRWVLLRRIERAGRLLRTTERSVVEIAYDCGFSSSQHLASAFRAHRLTTPTRFRHGAG